MSSKPREGFDCDYELSIKDNQDINLNQDYIELDPATMARRRNDGSYDNPLPMSIGITPKQAARATLDQDKRVENSTGFREKHPQSPDRPLSLKTVNCVIVVYGILLLISIALGAIGAFKEENKDANTTLLAESHAALLKSLDIINGICNERDANGDMTVSAEGTVALQESLEAIKDVCTERDAKVSNEICAVEWLHYGGHCYRYYAYLKVFNDARQFCQIQGADIVTIHTQVENDIVNNIANGEEIWIGLNDLRTKGEFEWIDGSPVNYTNWNPGQPNDDVLGCVGMNFVGFPAGVWHDIGCVHPSHFVCMY